MGLGPTSSGGKVLSQLPAGAQKGSGLGHLSILALLPGLQWETTQRHQTSRRWALGAGVHAGRGEGQDSVTIVRVDHRRDTAWRDWDVDRISILTVQRRKLRHRGAG